MIERVTGLEWQRAALPPSGSCADLTLAGHHDWRVPSRLETISLLAYGDAWRKSEGPFPIAGALQSSSTFNGTGYHWAVNLGYASIQYGGSPEIHCVRTAVVVVAKTPSYVIDGPIVTDTATGLSWERDWGSDWSSLPNGQMYCAALELGGYDDWRVPSLQELASIIDDRAVNPAVDRSAFIGDSESLYAWTWSSTIVPSDSPGRHDIGRTMRFFDGSTITQSPSDQMRVRCTR